MARASRPSIRINVRRAVRPGVRLLALLLAAQAALPPVARAADRGAVAVLPLAAPADAGAAALWDQARRALLGDPALVAQDSRETADLLAGWAEERRRAEGERAALALALRGEVDRLRQEAWKDYYRMDFAGAAARADRAAETAPGLDDGALAADWACEMRLLLGMSRRAGKDPAAAEAFLAAARLRPEAVLPPGRYSPEIIAAFSSASGKVRAGPRSALALSGGPPGAEALLDGRPQGALPLLARDLLPGPHHLEVRAEGYVPMRRAVELPAWGTAEVACALAPAGPAPGEDVSAFLSRRARAADSAALGGTAQRLGVAHLVWAEAEGKALAVWRSDAAGNARSRAASSAAEVVESVSDLRATTGAEALAAIALPAPGATGSSDRGPAAEKKGGWIWWVLGGVALALGAAGSAGGGGTGGVSVSW
jgi:hypothetical protein